MAEILKVHVDEMLMDKNGKILLENANLVCYIHGEYFGIKKKPIGKFGYSIMKPKTKKRINREKSQGSRRKSKK